MQVLKIVFFLYKILLCLITLYARPVWGFTQPRSINEIQRMQNTTLCTISKASCYLRNNITSKDFKIFSIRESIKTFDKKFYSNLTNIGNNFIQNLAV